jgi:hypothetical protein
MARGLTVPRLLFGATELYCMRQDYDAGARADQRRPGQRRKRSGEPVREGEGISALSGDRLFRVRDLVAHLAFEGRSLN